MAFQVPSRTNKKTDDDDDDDDDDDEAEEEVEEDEDEDSISAVDLAPFLYWAFEACRANVPSLYVERRLFPFSRGWPVVVA